MTMRFLRVSPLIVSGRKSVSTLVEFMIASIVVLHDGSWTPYVYVVYLVSRRYSAYTRYPGGNHDQQDALHERAPANEQICPRSDRRQVVDHDPGRALRSSAALQRNQKAPRRHYPEGADPGVTPARAQRACQPNRPHRFAGGGRICHHPARVFAQGADAGAAGLDSGVSGPCSGSAAQLR